MKRVLYLILLTSVMAVSCNPAKFTVKDRKIIHTQYERDVMPLMLVNNKADSIILYTPSENFKVNPKDRNLRRLVDLMYHTCTDTLNPGVGIAAPQVGVNKRIVWVQRFDKKENPFEVYFNAEILFLSKSQSEGWEGCLSVPNYRALVQRSDTIVIRYDSYEKRKVKETVTGFTAVIFQHEIDHLNGKLYLDRVLDKEKLFTEEEYLFWKASNSK